MAVPPETASDAKNTPQGTGRMRLLRELLVFQVKLAADGLRDVLLSPISMFVGIVGVILPSRTRLFYDLLRFGKRTDRWIDLFGAADRLEEHAHGGADGIDATVEKLQARLVQEYRRGGVSAAARDTLDQAIAALRRDPEDKDRP